jgi:hypothetical protein
LWIRIRNILPVPDPKFSSWIQIRILQNILFGFTPTSRKYTYTNTYKVHIRQRGTVHTDTTSGAATQYTHTRHRYISARTATPTADSYTYEEQLKLRGTFTHTRYGTATVHLQGKATPTRYCYTYEVLLHLRGTATPTRYGTATSTRYGYTYELRLHLQDTSRFLGTTRYGYTYEVWLHLRGTTTYTALSWNSLQVRTQTVRKYKASTNTSDVRVP